MLDAACATGYGSHILSKVAGKVIGLEVDKGCIQSANDLWKRGNTTFNVSDLNNTSLPDCDVAVSIETIEHLDDMYHFVNQLHEKVRRLIIVTVPIGGTSWAYKDEEPSPATEKNDFMSDADVDNLLAPDGSGWKKQSGFRYGYSYFGVFFKKELAR